jgi:hypothetical protein
VTEVRRIVVLYDAGCPICRTARDWLVSEPALVPVDCVPAGSDAARSRFPGLDHPRTLRDVTVLAERAGGYDVYTQDGAWLMCLWALERYRPTALRLARPGWRTLAKRFVAIAAAVRDRRASSMTSVPSTDDCGDGCAR